MRVRNAWCDAVAYVMALTERPVETRQASPRAAWRLMLAVADDPDAPNEPYEALLHATDCPHGCHTDRYCEHGWQAAQGTAGIG